MLVCVSKQASKQNKQASTHHGWHSLCVSKFSSKLCFAVGDKERGSKNQNINVPQEGKESKAKGNMPNKISLSPD